jgi:hypothetical protein
LLIGKSGLFHSRYSPKLADFVPSPWYGREGAGHQQLPLRLMLGLKRFSLHQRLNSSLPNCEPWSDWMITEPLGRRRHTAIVNAFRTKVASMLPLMLQPTTALECKSSTTAK